MEKKELFALIVAGGSGARMEMVTPKQFLHLGNKPILMHTIAVFYQIDQINIVIVLPADHIDYWKKLCGELDFNIPHSVVEGGKTRGESVVNGLNTLPDEGLVAIHDGVRPFIAKEIIIDSFNTAKIKGSAVTVVDLKDSIREVTPSGSKAVDRVNYKIVQTPQTFKISLIKDAYKKVGLSHLTDDAAVAEAAGNEIQLIRGSYDNIKITTPEDLIIGQEILKKL